jgi:hypothetical protein
MTKQLPAYTPSFKSSTELEPETGKAMKQIYAPTPSHAKHHCMLQPAQHATMAPQSVSRHPFLPNSPNYPARPAAEPQTTPPPPPTPHTAMQANVTNTPSEEPRRSNTAKDKHKTKQHKLVHEQQYATATTTKWCNKRARTRYKTVMVLSTQEGNHQPEQNSTSTNTKTQ